MRGLSLLVDSMLNLGHLLVDEVFVAYELQVGQDATGLIVPVLGNELCFIMSVLLRCRLLSSKVKDSRTHRGDSGRNTMSTIVRRANKHCKASGNRNCASLSSKDIP